MGNINVELINEKIEDFVTARDWDQFHTLKNLVMALSVESSELLEIFQWLTEEEAREISLKEKEREKICDEIADIFIYLLRVSSKLNIDIENAALKKIEKNNLKYPVEKSRGSVKKYTEFT